MLGCRDARTPGFRNAEKAVEEATVGMNGRAAGILSVISSGENAKGQREENKVEKGRGRGRRGRRGKGAEVTHRTDNTISDWICHIHLPVRCRFSSRRIEAEACYRILNNRFSILTPKIRQYLFDLVVENSGDSGLRWLSIRECMALMDVIQCHQNPKYRA